MKEGKELMKEKTIDRGGGGRDEMEKQGDRGDI